MFRLRPNAEVKAKLANHAGAGRFLWNKLLALNLSRLESKQNLICGHQTKENRKAQSQFACTTYGHKANADDAGALNVLARGHRVLA